MTPQNPFRSASYVLMMLLFCFVDWCNRAVPRHPPKKIKLYHPVLGPVRPALAHHALLLTAICRLREAALIVLGLTLNSCSQLPGPITWLHAFPTTCPMPCRWHPTCHIQFMPQLGRFVTHALNWALLCHHIWFVTQLCHLLICAPNWAVFAHLIWFVPPAGPPSDSCS